MARHRRATACAPFSWDVQVYDQPRTARSAQPSSLPTLFPHASIYLRSINISCTSMTRSPVMFFPLVVHLMSRCKPPPRPQPPVITTFCHSAALASPRLPPPSPPPPSPQTRPLRTVCMLDDTVGVVRIGGDGDKFGLLHAPKESRRRPFLSYPGCCTSSALSACDLSILDGIEHCKSITSSPISAPNVNNMSIRQPARPMSLIARCMLPDVCLLDELAGCHQIETKS